MSVHYGLKGSFSNAALEVWDQDTLNAVWKAWKTETIYPWIVSVCEVTVRPWVWLHVDGIIEASLQQDDRNEHIGFP